MPEGAEELDYVPHEIVQILSQVYGMNIASDTATIHWWDEGENQTQENILRSELNNRSTIDARQKIHLTKSGICV